MRVDGQSDILLAQEVQSRVGAPINKIRRVLLGLVRESEARVKGDNLELLVEALLR